MDSYIWKKLVMLSVICKYWLLSFSTIVLNFNEEEKTTVQYLTNFHPFNKFSSYTYYVIMWVITTPISGFMTNMEIMTKFFASTPISGLSPNFHSIRLNFHSLKRFSSRLGYILVMISLIIIIANLATLIYSLIMCIAKLPKFHYLLALFVLDNWRAAVVVSRLSYITGCSLFNHNPWFSWSKGVGCKLKGEKVMSCNLWWWWQRVATGMEPR